MSRSLVATIIAGLIFAGAVPVLSEEKSAISDLRKAAEQGNATAEFNLGLCYAKGKGVAQDYTEAVKWFRKAAEQGFAAAQYTLGFCYAEGKGVAQNYTEAVKWSRKAAEQNNAEAQNGLGVSYATGKGVAQDYTEAVKWYRKAAEQGNAVAQYNLGFHYLYGQGVAKDEVEAVKWFRKAAEQGFAQAQFMLGSWYAEGKGVAQDYTEAVKWYRKAAEQGFAAAQHNLGHSYLTGDGVTKDYTEAVKWIRKAAEQGEAYAQYTLGFCYAEGNGVPRDYVEAYRWSNLSAAQGIEAAKKFLLTIERSMTANQIAEAQRLSREFVPHKRAEQDTEASRDVAAETQPSATGTGFFITDDGFLMTNAHVVMVGAKFKLVTSSGVIVAHVIKVDKSNDLALLKAEGRFSSLPVAASRAVRLGNTVITVGFPNVGLQGFAPKFAKGEIAALSGIQDDARCFQVSVPVQPGNSGGALVDEHGNVVGIVSAKLSAEVALAATGNLPENVNYAVKSGFLLSFLESQPDILAKLKAPNAKDEKFEDVVKSVEQATALVLVY